MIRAYNPASIPVYLMINNKENDKILQAYLATNKLFDEMFLWNYFRCVLQPSNIACMLILKAIFYDPF